MASLANESKGLERPANETGTDFHVLLATIVCAVYGVISVGFFSNVVVAVVVGNILLRLSSTLPNRHMLVYVFALCIVDALVLGTLPMLIIQIYLQTWIFGQTMCTVYWTVDSINKTLSTFILLCLSFERYLAVRFPHRCMRIRTVRGALCILFFCLILAALLLMPVYLHAEVTYVDVEPIENATQNRTEVPTCAFTGQTSFIFTIFVLCYCVPFACMSFFYGSILVRLRDRSKKLGVRQGRIRRVTTKTLTLVISYFICWTPYWAVTFAHILSDALKGAQDPDDAEVTTAPSPYSKATTAFADDGNKLNRADNDLLWNAITFGLLYATHSGCYLNSAINPILYALLNRELRRQHCAAMSSSGRTGGSQVLFNSVYAGSAKVSQGGTSLIQPSPQIIRAQQPNTAAASPQGTKGADQFLSPNRAFAQIKSTTVDGPKNDSGVRISGKVRKGKFWIWKFRKRDVQCGDSPSGASGKNKSFKYGKKDFIVANTGANRGMVDISSYMLSSDSDKSVPVLL